MADNSKYLSKYTGTQIDDAIGYYLTNKDNVQNNVIRSSASNPFNLDILLNGGTYIVAYYTHSYDDSYAPNAINVSVAKLNDTTIMQEYVYKGVTMERFYNTEETIWSNWKIRRDVILASETDKVQVGKPTLVLRECILDSDN